MLVVFVVDNVVDLWVAVFDLIFMLCMLLGCFEFG